MAGMAGYAPPKFRGLAGEDPAVFIRDLRQWCEASPNHNPNADIKTEFALMDCLKLV
ncbi:7279_t:CDS:2 [Paraglomus brasilianum]|uniref:7279_t:CDS:1 n=1 Tax=Paraglomus brasilianum TaxID=144538 RepID=A0A9N9GQN3_9GLOM|nr:7279_t:CDS:2 [Paraglomus brasilianum]